MDNRNYSEVHELYKQLKKGYPQMTDYEILSIACKMQHNEILISALYLPKSDDRPAAIEAIAQALGFSERGDLFLDSIQQSLDRINDSLNAINSSLETGLD